MPTKIKCPSCGHVLSIKTPGQAGIFRAKCPDCGTAIKFRIGSPAAEQQHPVRPQPPTPPEPANIGQFEVSTTHDATCPVCGRPTKVHLSKRGPQQVQCNACGSMLIAEGMPAATQMGLPGGFTGNMRRGIIRVHKRGLSKMLGKAQQMMLRPGSNIIGRYDIIAPSDFSLKDQAVSRRSLEIFVSSNPIDGIAFKLTVLKSANPVYHNGRIINVGDSMALKFGDSIRLGTTTIDLIPE